MFQNGMRVAILGGGQLGCMLMDAALELGLSPVLYAEAGTPAHALYPGRTVEGALKGDGSEHSLRAFFSSALGDQAGRTGTHLPVAFENEFLDCDLLERAARGTPAVFGPSLAAIRELQDKLLQKDWMTRLQLPTSPYLKMIPGQIEEGVTAAVDRAYAELSGAPVFKWSRLGYDGKGVLLARDTTEGRRIAREFCESSLARGVAVYAEARIAFRRELAVIGVRGERGDFTAYPLVVSEQEEGICKKVLGPASALGVPAALEIQAREYARRLAEALNLTGTFAIELFETPEGRLAINEVAPRVHNSGHYTQDACAVSQFHNHWRALLGMALGDPTPTGAFGMLNLLGPEGIDVSVSARRQGLPFPSPPHPLKLHWYAKTKVCARRKVGHVNASVADAGLLPAVEKQFVEYETLWRESLQRLAQNAPHPERKHS
jgi:5-(carboxyamino)imidazole ribonucleotide synthase